MFDETHQIKADNHNLQAHPRSNDLRAIHPRESGLTLENILSLELGSLEVVTRILGSSTPAHLYSSSMCELTPAQTRANQKQ